MAPPLGSRTLNPLSAGGLWLAVMLISADGVANDNAVRNNRSGCASPGKMHGDIVAGQDFGHRGSEILSAEAKIATNDNALLHFFRCVCRLQVAGESLRAAPQIVESVTFGDLAAPAIGAEFDFVM